MHPRSLPAVAVIGLALGLAGCASTASTPSGAASSAPSATSTTATSPAPASSPAANPSTSPASTATAAIASGRCASIDQPTAESILGFSTKPGISSAAGGVAGFKKVDGCSYISATAGSLGYDVVRVSPQIGQSMIGGIKARMSAAGGTVTVFEVGLPNSVGFTQHLPAGVDSQVTVMAGDLLITVASTRKDGNVAQSQAAAIAAAKKLAST